MIKDLEHLEGIVGKWFAGMNITHRLPEFIAYVKAALEVEAGKASPQTDAGSNG